MPFPYTFPFYFQDKQRPVGGATVVPGGPASAVFPYTFPFHFPSFSSLSFSWKGKGVGGTMPITGLLEYPWIRPRVVGNGTITPVADTSHVWTRVLAVGSGIITASGGIYRQAAILLESLITPASDLSKQTSKYLSGLLTPASVNPVQARYRTTTIGGGTLTPASTMLRKTSNFLGGVLTPASDVSKQTSKFFTGSVASSGAWSRSLQKLVAAGGSLTPVATLAKLVSFTMAGQGTVTPTSTSVKQTSKSVAGSVIPSNTTLFKTTKTFLGGTVTSSGAWSRMLTLYRVVGLGSTTPSGVVTRTWLKDVGSATITPFGGANYAGSLVNITSLLATALRIVAVSSPYEKIGVVASTLLRISSQQFRR